MELGERKGMAKVWTNEDGIKYNILESIRNRTRRNRKCCLSELASPHYREI